MVDMVQRFGLVAFLCGGDQPWRPGAGARSSQPYLGPRGVGRCPGDMMIDWVSPPAGMRPLSLIRPSAWPLGPAAADSGSAGAGRGGPHRVSSAACVVRAGRRSWAGHRVMERGSQAADSASSPSSARMWQACRRILRASDSAARLPLQRSLTWA